MRRKTSLISCARYRAFRHGAWLPLRLTPRRASHASARRAFSLFEVLISLAIFGVSLAAIGQLISTGVRGSVQSRLQTQAIFRCESKLAEVIAGITPLQSASEQPFPDDSAWTWSVALAAGPQIDLSLVVVSVEYTGEGSLSSTSYSLSRLVRDPEAVAAIQQEKQDQAQSSRSSSSSSGSSSSRSGSSGGSR